MNHSHSTTTESPVQPAPASPSPPPEEARGKTRGRIPANVFLNPLVLVLAAWSLAALNYDGPSAAAIRIALMLLVALGALATMAALILWRRPGRFFSGFMLGFVVLLVWWRSIPASNDRPWQADVAKTPHAEVAGNLVVLHNIRNFDYRSETDFTPAYYDATFDAEKLASVDLIASHWAGPDIAHILLSFGFEDGRHLAVSIETRKEVGEGYSTIKGFFKQYELIYVAADERDVVRLRTNIRKDPPEDVYLYPVRAPLENGRRLFLEYIKRMNALNDKPEYYNTLTTNCTTSIWSLSRINSSHVPLSWKVLLSGHVPEYLQEMGLLDAGVPFAELKERAHINARALKAGDAADFSQRIRGERPPNPPATANE